ncbi:MAG: SMR family transporter [Chloroflexota bacterium]
MSGVALALVLSSAVMHASWNYLVKRSHDKVLFFWAMAALGFTGLIVPGIALALYDGFTPTMLGFACISICLHASYAITLTASYKLGDLSSVYPISRGMGPALVPLLAVLLLGESVSAVAVVGIVLVVLGIYATHIDTRFLRDISHPLKMLSLPATRIAFLTGFIIAGYTISDKTAINHDLNPVTLSLFDTFGNVIGLLPAVVGAGLATLQTEWRFDTKRIVAAGILAPTGYLLVLIALTTTRVAYVAPSREVGIVIGAALGVFLLGEGYGLTRIWGSALVVAGVVVIALAP